MRCRWRGIFGQLALDPLTAAPELVGREIRNHLDAAKSASGGAWWRCRSSGRWWRRPNCRNSPKRMWQVFSSSKLNAVSRAMWPTHHRHLPQQIGGGRATATFISMPGIICVGGGVAGGRVEPETFARHRGIAADRGARRPLALTIGESHVGLQITHGGGHVVAGV